MPQQRSPEFDAAMMRELPGLRRYAIRLCRNADTAEDLVQETVLRVLANLDKFDGSNLIAWMTTILHNNYRQLYRKGKHSVEDPDAVLAGKLRAHDNPLEQLIARETIESINMLPAWALRPLMMTSEGVSQEEIAHECMIPVGTVKSRVSKARDLLSALGD